MSLLHAEATNGWFELSPAYGYRGIKGKAAYGEMHFEEVFQQALEMDAIAKSIRKNRPSPVTGEMGKEDVQLLLAIYKAMETGERVVCHPLS